MRLRSDMFLDCRYLAEQLKEASPQTSRQRPTTLGERVEVGKEQAGPSSAGHHLPWLHLGQPCVQDGGKLDCRSNHKSFRQFPPG